MHTEGQLQLSGAGTYKGVVEDAGGADSELQPRRLPAAEDSQVIDIAVAQPLDLGLASEMKTGRIIAHI